MGGLVDLRLRKAGLLARKAAFGGLCFLLPWSAGTPSFAESVDLLKKGVVRIAATVGGNPNQGTGFIVRREPGAVYIVTASHVVEGADRIEVEFFTSRNRPATATVIGIEGDDPHGLAALFVQGELPEDMSVLMMNPDLPVRAGDPVTMIGFPGLGAAPWTVSKGEIVGRKGKSIIFSGAVEKGSSGGPLIKDDQVVGIITRKSQQWAYAAPAVIAQYALESWAIRFGVKLRSEPAAVSGSGVVHLIRSKGFNHPSGRMPDGSQGGQIGNFRHEYKSSPSENHGLVVDGATGLMWQQSGSDQALSFQDDAGEYVRALNGRKYAGFEDWRLPTVEELMSLMEPIGMNDGIFLSKMFDSKQWVCWSADRADEAGHSMWGVNFRQGRVLPLRAKDRMFVRAVRSLKQGDLNHGP